MLLFVRRIRTAALALACAAAFMASHAAADVIANGADFTVSYSTDLQVGTVNGNPITSLFILETDGPNISVERAPTIPGSGPVTVTHIVPFRPTASLLIGLDLATAGVSDGKAHIVMFMDVDFVLQSGVVKSSFPLFALDPELHALTTDEHVMVRGPWWMQSWLNMRLAQRRMAMQSHALSNRVLTLTGRCSVFRGTHIVEDELIRLA